MKRIVLGFLLVVIWQISLSQKVYFVYLQSEQEQPFFVKMNDKIYSSTASGYLILSKLYDSSYSFSVGFPGNKWPEQRFSVFINKKDHGYLLKNFADKGWGLFDLQSLGTQMAMPEEKKTTAIRTEKKEVSEFTDILSKAADDSSLKEKQVLIKEEKKPDTIVQAAAKTEETKPDTIVQAVVKKEEIKPEEKPVVKTEEPKTVNKDQPVIKTEETKPDTEKVYKRSVITRRSESSTTTGVGLTFIDDYQNGKKDTIHILIPQSKSLTSAVKQEPKEEKKFLEVFPDSTKKEKDNLQEVKDEKPVASQSIKNNCSKIASGDDFLVVRRNMAAKKGDDAMINEAKKYFRTKCFTTSQIKNLGFLFLSDEGKYKFFDAAYNYTSDIENFSSLQTEMKDEYFINRFKAMLRN